MTDDNITSSNLRKKAEEILKKRLINEINTSNHSNEIIHELRVNQIELEIQNEELRESQRKLENSKNKYFDLYNFAPIGYFTLDKNCIILDVNLTGAGLLGVERSNLYKTAFIQYIFHEDRNNFYHHILNGLKTGYKQNFELELLKMDSKPFCAYLEIIVVSDENGNFKEFRITISDIQDIKNTKNALKKSEDYGGLFFNNHTVMLLIDPNTGEIIDANTAAVKFYGYNHDELVKMNITDLRDSDADVVMDEMKLAASKQKNHFIFKHQLSNGEIRIVDVYSGLIKQNGKDILYSIIHDISDQKRIELEREGTVEFLRLVNESNNVQDLVYKALKFFTNQSGCEAVGIRLHEGFDYPYYETKGFPEEFIQMENHLCEYDTDGHAICDNHGEPILECMCGNVLKGRFDPSQPFFTNNGSFWTNSTTSLLTSTSEDDRQSRTRNRCNGQGYESVALIPLNSGGEYLGLLQLNDRRKDLFSEKSIAMWERMAGYLTIALAKFRAEEETVKHAKILESINQVFQETLTCETEEDVVGKCLEVAENLTESEFGFFGEINENGRLDYMAFTSPVWEACEIPNAIESIMDMEIVSYWGRTIIEEKSQIVNHPESDPDRRGLPEGHPIIDSFLGVPLKQGGKTIGVIALANKKSGYNEEDMRNVETISGAFVEALMRKRAEIKIIEAKSTLERKVEERTQELKSANKYNRSLLEASLDPLVTIAPDGKITDVNHSTENVTGFSRHELIGTDFLDYFTEPKKAREGYLKVFKEGSVLDYPLEIINKNGNVTPVLYNASVYKDEFDNVIGIFAAARDITEIRKAEKELKDYQDTLEEKVKKRTEELANSNAELVHFAYVASHDLREPLRMITSFLQLLEKRYSDKLDQDATEFIGFAVDGAKRLDNMINDLLEYSKVTKQERELTRVNFENILEEALKNLKIPIEETNAIITHDKLPTLNADEKLLVLLLQNLISNAIKYRGDEIPKIHISAYLEDDRYIFSVKDNGIGIGSDHLKRIFTIFQRLHRNDEYEGTGIGLAIAEKIVYQHGGRIWAESELGKGTTFYFTIPLKIGLNK